MIPSIEKCLYFMDKYRMLVNIKAHSIMVGKVANLIARRLRNAGIDISVEKAVSGALMHDIGKTISLKSGGNHAEIGRQICIENHLDEIADIVGEHVILSSYCFSGPYTEKEIVYYSDKRVNHDKIVTLEERLAYILERYGKKQESLCLRIRKNFELCESVQKKLFLKLDFEPESLFQLGNNEKFY